MSDWKPDVKDLLNRPDPPKEAAVKCRECKRLYIATPHKTQCTYCRFNYFWIDEESEKFSGPKFIKDEE